MDHNPSIIHLGEFAVAREVERLEAKSIEATIGPPFIAVTVTVAGKHHWSKPKTVKLYLMPTELRILREAIDEFFLDF